MTIAEILDGANARAGDLRTRIDGLSPAARVTECVALTAAQQKRLWEVVSADPAVKGVLLPPGGGTAVFAGRNSLRFLTRFEKCFASLGPATVGYNRHSLGWLIGPGYFTVTSEPKGGLLIDYEQVPAEAPPGWPPVASNDGFFAGQVYGHLSDRVEWVSADVLIGLAYRAGKALDSYFVLARLPV